MRKLPAELLDAPVEGLNLAGATLRDQLNSEGQTLLVFLRHFGCIFCREMVGDLRRISRLTPDYPPILFFYQGTVEEGAAFMRKLWAEARAIADLPKRFYNAFGLERGGIGQMFGAQVWACGVRAASKGHFIGRPVGDPWTMPGLFLVEQDTITWQHDFKHAGDHPDWRIIPRVASQHRLQPASL
jgi:hypothetical protein